MTTIATIELQYEDKTYHVPFVWSTKNGMEESYVIYFWEKGVYSCDCNRSVAIKRECDSSFPRLKCALPYTDEFGPNQIKLNSIKFSDSGRVFFPKKGVVDIVNDPVYTLKEWAELIENLISKYGVDATLETDGGYNNVQMILKY